MSVHTPGAEPDLTPPGMTLEQLEGKPGLPPHVLEHIRAEAEKRAATMADPVKRPLGRFSDGSIRPAIVELRGILFAITRDGTVYRTSRTKKGRLGPMRREYDEALCAEVKQVYLDRTPNK